MNSKIKVIKATRANPNSTAPTVQKTERERDRETADTVKSWISEWVDRRRSRQTSL